MSPQREGDIPATFKTTRPRKPEPAPLPPGWETPHRFIYPPVGPPPANWPRAVIYCRQSKLNEDGSNASPQMQKTAGEGLCQARSYNPVACFTDAGKSGWDPRVKRTGFDEMMEWVRAKKCDVVVIFALSRLTRQGAIDALEIEAEMRKNGVTLVSVQEPYLDTSDAIGIGIFAIIAGLAKQESDNKSAFITNARELARQAGGHLAGSAPFGMRSVKAKTVNGVSWVKLVPEDDFWFRAWTEADTVRRMVEMAMGNPDKDIPGRSPGKIAEWLNAEGIPTPAQRKVNEGRKFNGHRTKVKAAPPHWSSSQVHRILRDPRIAGMAADKVGVYHYELRLGDDGTPMHVHEGIITAAKWYRLQNTLGVAGKKGKQVDGTTRTLLSGWNFARCECGAFHTYSGKPSASRSPYYRCSRTADSRKALGNGHTANAIQAESLDEYVARRVFARMLAIDTEDADDLTLAREAARRFAAQTDTSDTGRKLDEFKAQLAYTQQSLTDLYEERALYKGPEGKKAWRNAVSAMLATQARCQEQIERLEEDQTERIVMPIDQWSDTNTGDPIGPKSPWSQWGLIKRREFLSLWLDGVTIHQPANPQSGPKATPIELRVTFQWAQPTKQEDEDDDEPLTLEGAQGAPEAV
ncbi:recombinase family protein [Streptomyces sp. NPDC006879]|uniref:recombinase family protein n=1 Tax=Streptomyces sp. NPDC006879 TaxID=3364767 RepID=UPI00369C6A4A